MALEAQSMAQAEAEAMRTPDALPQAEQETPLRDQRHRRPRRIEAAVREPDSELPGSATVEGAHR